MKKITLLAAMLSLTPIIHAQCNENASLPYLENFDTALPPDLPDCTFSNKQTFVGGDWETVAAPNNNFLGNVARYITNTDQDWSMYCIYSMRSIQLTAGMAYRISYKYAHDGNDTTIDYLNMGLYRTNSNPNIELTSHENITGTEVILYTSELFTVPATEVYYPHFDIISTGSQGILYLDDIKIEEMGVMEIKDNELTKMSFYPNPVKDKLTITTSGGETIELYNTAGQLLLTQPSTDTTTIVNLENISSGIYLLKTSSHKTTKTVQLIKE